MRYTKFFAIVACLLLPGCAFKGGVRAQEDPGIEVRPAILDVSGKPGSIIDLEVNIRNTSSAVLGVSVKSRSLAPEDELLDSSQEDRYDASLWINAPRKFFLIEGNQSTKVPVEIKIPDDAVPGGHYAVVVFGIESVGLQDDSGVQVNREVGAVALINVPGDTVESVKVNNSGEFKLSFGGLFDIEQEIINNGNTHVLPVIETIIYDGNGNKVESFTQPIRLLLPNTKRKIANSWDSKKYFGRYSAETTVTYGTPSQNYVSNRMRTWVLPSLIFVILAVIIMPVIFRYGFVKLYKRSEKFRKIITRLHSTVVRR